MIKFIDLLNEIKINQPGSSFMITDKGKQAIQNYYKLNDLLKFFGEEDPVDFLASNNEFPDAWHLALTLVIWEDEKIIFQDKPNKLEYVYNKVINHLGSAEDEEEVNGVLRKFIKQDWITKVNI